MMRLVFKNPIAVTLAAALGGILGVESVMQDYPRFHPNANRQRKTARGDLLRQRRLQDQKSCGSCCYTIESASNFNTVDSFYSKVIDLDGFLVVSSAAVSDAALYEAALLYAKLTESRSDFHSGLVSEGVIMAVIGKDEGTTDLPEYSLMDTWWPLANGETWNDRVRGVGATPFIPVSSCAEEDLLCLASDRYYGENICLHETAHTVHGPDFETMNPPVEKGGTEDLDTALEELYAEVVTNGGKWAGDYGGTNHIEYFAEGVQAYFNQNFNSQYVNTKTDLENYDPGLYSLISRVFPDEISFSCPVTTDCDCASFQCPGPTSVPNSSPVRITSTPTRSPVPASSPVITTSRPTSSPVRITSRPTSSPITSFRAPTDNSDATDIEVVVPGSVGINGVVCVAGEEAAHETSVKNALRASGCPPIAGPNCDVKVNKMECQSRRRLFRGLQSTSSLMVEFEMILTVYCQTNDCSDATDVVNGAYSLVTDTFSTAIADNTFIGALQSSSSGSNTFDASIVETSSVTFEEVIAPLLEALTQWYPSWHDGTNTCLNDGSAPAYMTNTNYIYSSLEACCNSLYSWDFITCMILGGASSASFGSDKFYVDYWSDSCKQSCVEGTAGLNCGGVAPSWKALFATAESCCDETLWWAEKSKCVADSTLIPSTTPAGSGEWYVIGQKCVKDCEDSSDSQCGGLAERWDDTFRSSRECCTNKLWWVQTKNCT